MPNRIYLFNITTRQLLFWDEVSSQKLTWHDVEKLVPAKWSEDHEIVCNIATNGDERNLYMLNGKDTGLIGFYNPSNLLCSFELGLNTRKRWHVNDFHMLPDPTGPHRVA